ncbi:MAG TPA: PP2C family protein-serine/threonine phosphatase [Mycobacteriales bacterium]|nr:PP2C family protein-serine/threonine phosphatase [Mycobacteriales bacterium]
MTRRSWTRLSVLVLVLVLALTALGTWTVRNVVHNQENQLLSERSNEVGLVLKEAVDSLSSELHTVGGVLQATNSSPAAFRRASAALVAASKGNDSVALLQRSVNGFRVQLADGDAFAVGEQIAGPIAVTLSRAAAVGDVLPTQVMGAGQDRTLGLALGPPAAPAGTVLYLQAALGTLGPPRAADTAPFNELRVVLYGTPTPIASQALVTTTSDIPLTGDVRTVPVAAGAASWSLQVSAAHPLVGATAANAQWLALAGGVALALLLALVVEVESRRRRSALDLYRNEHRLAEGLQRSLLPALPVVTGLELAARYLPGATGQQVGGDWYDVFELDGGYVGFVIGDVLGHDIDAAVLMSRVQTALRAHALVGEQPAAVLDRLDQLVQSLQTDRLVTVFYGLLEPADADGNRRLVFANAGHPPPLLHDPRNGTREIDEAESILLGVPVLLTEPRSQKSISLPPDATLVFYTDGLIEVPGLSLTDLIAKLRETTTAAVRDASAAQVCERLVAKIHPTARRDDVAILVVQLPSATLSGCTPSDDSLQPQPLRSASPSPALP